MQNTILLIIGLVLALIYLWFLFCIVYHLIRFGIGSLPKILALIFFLGSFCLFGLTMLLFIKIDWQALINQVLQILQIN